MKRQSKVRRLTVSLSRGLQSSVGRSVHRLVSRSISRLETPEDTKRAEYDSDYWILGYVYENAVLRPRYSLLIPFLSGVGSDLYIVCQDSVAGRCDVIIKHIYNVIKTRRVNAVLNISLLEFRRLGEGLALTTWATKVTIGPQVELLAT